MLDQITPVLLTYNEDQNIGRTLSRLAWAKDVVVVDSGSTDGTLAVVAQFPNVRVFNRRFETHGKQWRYATQETKIATEWLLRLDADYHLSDALLAELARLDPNAAVSAYRVRFDYAVFSRKLLSSLYPSKAVLLRKGCFSVWDRGHSDAWDVQGHVVTLKGTIIHDDWKSISQWLAGEAQVLQREHDWIRVREAGLVRWLRVRPPLMPITVFLYCLFGKGLILNGRTGLFYALQRMVAESVLSLIVLEEKLRDPAARAPASIPEDHLE
jgi:glycosyltransferase involved in cell wall biosynthesis